jgi:catecholate siderophore receptor
MAFRQKKMKKRAPAHTECALSAIEFIAKPAFSAAVLPIGAMMLAGGAAFAQTPAQPQNAVESARETTLKPVIVRESRDAPGESGKDTVRATTTTIGKGQQQLRDIPQSITVVTEKLIDDRNLDTLKDVLHNTAGVTFLAAEGGEEDIRLRGFSLATSGDIFLDGMRDPAFYERDTFNLDRVELLRGSASMLFGRGSTGGAANQVTKLPRAFNEHEVGFTAGTYGYARVTGDFNWRTGEDQGLRLNLMKTQADNDGKGNGLDKYGVAAAYRFGIGTRNEFLVSLYHLDNTNPRMNYGLPWIRPNASSTQADNGLIPGQKATHYYGMASDYNAGQANILTLAHTHRFDTDVELKTQLRRGLYVRDQRASAIRFPANTFVSNLSPSTPLNRSANGQNKIQDMQLTQLQSDFSAKFNALGVRHELLTGVDFSVEERQVYAARSAAQGGNAAVPTKPPTSIGTPDDGAWVDESARILRRSNNFSSRALGVYVQDLIQVAPSWKLLAGLRYDRMSGNFYQYTIPTSAPGPETTVNYRQKISEVSHRFGALWQPNDLASYHISYGTSFNTSGDTYSYNSTNANVDPEQSRNFEIGAKLDSANKRFTTRLALFYAEKYNERNTDVDSAATSLLLSGKRHSAGFEVDFTGRITPQWEIYASYAWTPIAKVDKAAACPPAPATCLQSAGGAREGDRPGLIPKHSGTVFTSYQLTPSWRIGGGVNFRSSQAPADVGTPANGIWQAPGFATVDLMMEYRINDIFTLKANINNIANKYYADTLYRGHYIPGQGRVAYVNLNARF